MQEPKRTAPPPADKDVAVRRMQVLELHELEQRKPIDVSQSRIRVKSMQHLYEQLNAPISFDEISEAEDEALRLDAEEFRNAIRT
ncbi:MAG: hypothetical protein JKY67_08370 [Pseudomonadales bacterium]|nr:hypothetical protein [Pseudomonadales bacterium]